MFNSVFFTELNIDGAVFVREILTKKAFIFNLRLVAQVIIGTFLFYEDQR